MKEIIDKLLQENAADWQGILESKLGFGVEQAQKFVPALMGGLGEAFSSRGFDLGSLVGGFEASSLLEKIDLDKLAQESGATVTQVVQGIETLAPKLTEAVSRIDAEEGGVLGVLDAGGDPLKKLFGG